MYIVAGGRQLGPVVPAVFEQPIAEPELIKPLAAWTEQEAAAEALGRIGSAAVTLSVPVAAGEVTLDFRLDPTAGTNDEVVVSGAQLLLSEELKYQIRNENED